MPLDRPVNNTTQPTAILDAVRTLPPDWNAHGSFHRSVLDKLFVHALPRRNGASAETGTGKSTLLLSNLFQRHTVFALDDTGDGDSLLRVRESDLLLHERVQFVIGPTQQTLPHHVFDSPLQFVLIDGPHGYPFPELEYYFFYPQLVPGGMMVIDDIQIPTIRHLFNVLRRDAMWRLVEVERTTAFFERTDAPLFDPTGDGWWTQGYNIRHLSLRSRLGLMLPPAVKYSLQRILRQ
jgi:hypothetical protein